MSGSSRLRHYRRFRCRGGQDGHTCRRLRRSRRDGRDGIIGTLDNDAVGGDGHLRERRGEARLILVSLRETIRTRDPRDANTAGTRAYLQSGEDGCQHKRHEQPCEQIRGTSAVWKAVDERHVA